MKSHHTDSNQSKKGIYLQSETVKSFKHQFETRMHEFKEQVEENATKKGYYTSWRDILAGGAVSAVSLTGATVATVLGTVGVLAAVPSAGISLVVAVGGIAIGAGVVVGIGTKNKKEAKHANRLFKEKDDFDLFLRKITKNLLRIYQYQLENCSPKDAIRIADACYHGLKHQILTNKLLKAEDLLDAGHLQALIVASAAQIKKETVSINGKNNEKANSRGAVTHAGIYCHYNDQFYRAKSSKPEKYGVIFFWDKQEFKDYTSQVEKIDQHQNKWHYDKMPAAEVKALIRNQLVYSQSEDVRYLVRKSDPEVDVTVSQVRNASRPYGSIQLFAPVPSDSGDESKSTQRNEKEQSGNKNAESPKVKEKLFDRKLSHAMSESEKEVAGQKAKKR